MPILEIEGLGKVEVGDEFTSLPLDRQASEVDAIAATLRGQAQPQMLSDEQVAVAGAEQNSPPPDALKVRGSILPIGKDQEGNLVPALPGFLEGPRKTIMDLIDGRRAANQISGKEIFELGSLFAGSSPAAGTGKAIARAGAEKEFVGPSTPVPAPPAPVASPSSPLTGTPTEIQAMSKSYYKAAEDAGVVIKADSFRSLADDIIKTANKSGLDETLTPNAVAVIKRLNQAKAEPLSFEKLDLLRQVANDAKSGARPSDRSIAGEIVSKIDDYIAKLSDTDVLSGDPKIAADTIVKARGLWGVVRKLETMDEMIDRAKISAPNFSGSGFENALRTEFRQLAKNEKRLRFFSADERAAIKKVAQGGALANTARAVGKFAPTGVVSSVMSGGAGAAIGGPVGAVALPAVGFAGRALATALTKRNVNSLEAIVRAGGSSPLANAAISRSRNMLKSILTTAPLGAAANSQSKRK